MADPSGRPPWSEQVLRIFEFQGEKERGEVFYFQRPAKAFIGADSENLKMRRLPPTAQPRSLRTWTLYFALYSSNLKWQYKLKQLKRHPK